MSTKIKIQIKKKVQLTPCGVVQSTSVIAVPDAIHVKELTMVETFVGAGGAHLGFQKAGFKSLLVNDIDPNMIETLVRNHVVDPNRCLTCPIEEITQNMLEKDKSLAAVDVLFGGIVCKGFSLAGVRNPFDIRNYLYQHQLRLVEWLKPKVSIIENVVGIKNMILYHKCEQTQSIFEEYTKLSDANKDLNGVKSSKRKSNESYLDLNVTIQDNKKIMAQLIQSIEKYKYNVLDDIKQIYERLGYTLYEKVLQADQYGGYTNRKRLIMVAVRKDLNLVYHFPEELQTSYTLQDALHLIDYEGLNHPSVDEDNRPMNHTEKTISRFRLIPEGSNIGEVVDDLPDDLKISNFYSRGNTQRLDRNKPCPTLVPGHSNFPIHPWEHRSITVREAATITGFPTDYRFCGSHTSKCIQIGNAVPIQLAHQLARSVKQMLTPNSASASASASASF